MIRFPVASAVSLLARKLSAKGLRLEPIPGTLMDEINASLSIGFDKELISESDLPMSITSISDRADQVTDGQHRRALYKASEKLQEEGERVIKLCRNEVYPLIELLHEKTLDAVKIKKAGSVRQHVVVPYRPADIMFSDYITEICESVEHVHNAWGMNRELAVMRIFPVRTIDDLIVLCRTDHPMINAALDEAIGKYGEECLQRAYDIFFNASPQEKGYILNPMDLRNDGMYDGERLFGILLAQGMLKDMPSIRASLDDAKKYLGDVVRFCGSSLARYMKNYANQVEKKYLNLRRNHKSGTLTEILVNDQAYAYWQGQGLTDSAILGAMASTGARDAAKIMENKERYEADWAHNEKVIARTIESNTITAIQNGIIEVTLEEARKQLGDNYLSSIRKFEEGVKIILEKVRPTTDEDCYELVKEVVLMFFFSEKSVRCYVEAMDEVMKSSPSLDPREAAALAFIDMAVAWLLSQCTVVTEKQ